MAQSAAYDVAIAGAGPAALIAGDGLARSGLRVVLLGADNRPAPQASHVHLFRDTLWPRLFELVPELESLLRTQDASSLPPTALNRKVTPASRETQSPGSRQVLGDLLRRATSGSAAERRRERFRNACYDGAIWTVETTGGAQLGAAWLVDATGSARSTARAVGEALGDPLPLDEADAEFSYATWRFAGALPTRPGAVQQFWSPEFRVGVVVAPDEGTWLLTMQSPGPVADPLPTSPSGLLDAIGHAQLARVCAGAEAVGKPGRWSTAPITRMDLQSAASAGLPWLAIGDALVTTPPILGWGFEQIVEQCSVFNGCGIASDLAAACEPLVEASRVRFEQAIFATARRSGVLLSTPAASPSPQFQGTLHVDSSV